MAFEQKYIELVIKVIWKQRVLDRVLSNLKQSIICTYKNEFKKKWEAMQIWYIDHNK